MGDWDRLVILRYCSRARPLGRAVRLLSRQCQGTPRCCLFDPSPVR